MKKFFGLAAIIAAFALALALIGCSNASDSGAPFLATPGTGQGPNPTPAPTDSPTGQEPTPTVTPLYSAEELETPLTLEAIEDGLFVVINPWSTLKYKINDGDILSASDLPCENDTIIISVSQNDKISFFAEGSENDFSNDNEIAMLLGGNKPCYVYGNAMSLLDSENYSTKTAIEQDYAFACLFYDIPAFKDHSEKKIVLPATTLTKGCYMGMFFDSPLENMPKLPATSLAESCYEMMFYSCENLTTAPALPATVLAKNCYKNMFERCENLTGAPELPATTLAESCYQGMFNECENLTAAPALPATTLAEGCYRQMFSGCIKLENAPELPATTLAPKCYLAMFMSCLALPNAPALPATTLAEACYSSMFTNCENLTKAPDLNAAVLSKDCYREMFSFCKKLDSVKCLATDKSAENCTSRWLSKVADTGTFVKANGVDWESGANGIPSGWTTETAVPEYNIVIPPVAGGAVTGPLKAAAGTVVTLTIDAYSGYELSSISAGGVTLDGSGNTRTFTMPATDVTVSVAFSPIKYNIYVGTFANGSVAATPSTATIGTSVTLKASPAGGYELATLTVISEGGTPVSVSGTGNTRTFTMPAKNVTVAATFSVANYTVTCGDFANGSIAVNPSTATAGTSVTLTITPASGYKLDTVAVTDAGGASVPLNGTGYSRTFTMPAANVTVAATFAALPPAASGAYTKIDTTTINGVDYELVTFGLWPQTVKAESVTVNQSETKTAGDFTYCKGSDGEWYAKIKECPAETGFIYSDGTPVAPESDNSYKWFKVEPIKWRVLTINYGGKKLLLAENILIRKVYKNQVAGRNYWNTSETRKWLNSNANAEATSDHSGSGGFLKTAFTANEIAAIADTSVDNSARSTNPDANAMQLNGGINLSASDTPTIDKIFLLSEQEVTTSAYGFATTTNQDSARIRHIIDSAGGHGTMGLGCCWWLRSPDWHYINEVRIVAENGDAGSYAFGVNTPCGIVPALCMNFTQESFTIAKGSMTNGDVTVASSATYGSTVNIVAAPETGYQLSALTYTVDGGSPVNITGTGNDRIFTMPAGNVKINATFAPKSYTIEKDSMTNGSVTVDSSADYGSTVNVSASPATGYQLSALTYTVSGGSPVNIAGTGNTRSFTMPAGNVTINASFAPLTYSIAKSAMTNGSVTVASSADYGSTVTLTIAPNAGYELGEISASTASGAVTLSGEGKTSGSARTFAMPAGNVTISATFAKTHLGTKDKPDAIGDIVFNDGTATPYTAGLTLTDQQKAAAIAVICYADQYNGINGLGLKQAKKRFCKSEAGAYAKLEQLDEDNGFNNTYIYIKQAFKNIDYSEENYPAVWWATHYTGSNNLGSYKDSWYLPAVNEYRPIYDNLTVIQSALALIGSEYADPIDTSSGCQYGSSTQEIRADGSFPNWIKTFKFDGNISLADKIYEKKILVLRSFD